MKLHLPNILHKIVLTAAMLGTVHATTIELEQAKSTYVYQDNLIVGDNEYIGMLSGGSLVDDNFKEGTYTQSLAVREEKSIIFSTKYTHKNLTITGTGQVVVAGKHDSNTYAGITANKITVNGATGETAVTNLIASNINVNDLEIQNGTVELHTDLNSGSLIAGGNGYIGTVPSGSTSSAIMNNVANKQVTITNNLKVTGGKLTIGVTNGYGIEYDKEGKEQRHYLTGIGGDITQTAGTVTVHNMALVSGDIVIDQQGGVMSLSATSNGDEPQHRALDFNSNGKATIKQSGTKDTVLTLGKLGAYNKTYTGNNNVVEIIQSGNGTINLKEGVDYKSGSASSISQKAGGTINLNGQFTSVDFNLSQEGNNGTINLGTMTESGVETKATMNASSLQQSAGNTFVITKSSSLTADNISIGGTLKNYGTIAGADSDDLLTVVGQGQLINEGTLNIDLCLESGTLTASHNSIFTNLMAQAGTININGAITINGSLELGQIGSAYSLTKSTDKVTVNLTGDSSGIKLAEGATAVLGENVIFSVMVDSIDNMDTEKLLTVFTDAKGDEVDVDLDGATFMLKDRNNKTAIATYTDNGNGTVTLTVPEPTTATLSLLALAGLAARRRRK